MKMKLVNVSHPILLQHAKKVTKIDTKLKKQIEEMKSVLIESKIGIGLAAPQVGIPFQIFLISPNLPDSKNKYKEPITVYFNPKILHTSKEIIPHAKKTLEGCLSMPEVWGAVSRSNEVTLSYQDEQLVQKTQTFQGALARIVQHEIDHLHGILFTHRNMEQSGHLFRSDTLSGELEKIEI